MFKAVFLLAVASVARADLTGTTKGGMCADVCCQIQECGGTTGVIAVDGIDACIAKLPDGCSIYQFISVTANANNLQCATSTSKMVGIDLSPQVADGTYYLLSKQVAIGEVRGVDCKFDSVVIGSGDVCAPANGQTIPTTTSTSGSGAEIIVTVTPKDATGQVVNAVGNEKILYKVSATCDTSKVSSIVTSVAVMKTKEGVSGVPSTLAVALVVVLAMLLAL